jgi:hypothetical protein
MFMKDSDGRKSFTVTISIITFAVVMLKVLVGGTSFSVGGLNVAFGNIDAAEIVALLGPTLTAYTARRYTDAKYAPDATPAEDSGGRPNAGAE